MSFQESIADWSGFYGAAANAAAALLGLVFVGVSLRLSLHSDAPVMRAFAYGSAIALAQPLTVSLVMLLPAGGPTVQATAFMLLSAAGSVGLTRVLRAQLQSSEGSVGWLLYRYGLPLVACGVLAAGALGMLAGRPVALWAPAIFVFAMFSVGIENAWQLLVSTPGADPSTVPPSTVGARPSREPHQHPEGPTEALPAD